MTDPDPLLRRVEREAAIACVVMAALALALQRGDPSGALGVLGGGGIMAFSYRAIRGGVDAVVRRAAPDSEQPGRRGAPWWGLSRFLARYAVVGVAAWVLLVKIRAHPLGLVAGVTAPVLALSFEAWRLQRR